MRWERGMHRLRVGALLAAQRECEAALFLFESNGGLAAAWLTGACTLAPMRL